MATPIRQSTSRVVRIGPAVAVGDGFTPVTTLSLSAADEAEALREGTATLSISGATFAAVTGADGWYDLTLDTTTTNTVGELVIVINDDSLILPIYARFTVIEEAVYDRDYAGSATGIVGTAQTGDSYAIVNSGTHGNAALKTLIDTLDNFVDTEVAAIITTLGTPSNLGGGATIAANLSDIEGQTDDIGVAGAGLTAVPWNAAWATQVLSSITNDSTKINGIELNAISTDYEDGSLTDAVVNATWDELISGHLGAGSTGAALNAAGSAGDPWTTPLPGVYGSGTAGFIIGTNINATISSRSSQTSVDDLPTNAELATALGTSDDAVLAALTTLSTDVAGIPTNAELATAIAAGFTNVIAEPSARSDGAAGSAAQILYELLSSQEEKTVSGTSMLFKKLDGTTTLATLTLNDSTNPTSVTRSA